MSSRPMAITWAVVLTVASAVAGILTAAVWPDLEDRGFLVSVSVVAGVLLAIAAYFLWKGSFWGGVATIALNGLNVLSSIPAYFDDSGPDSLAFGISICIVLSAAAIVAAIVPSARPYWRRGVRGMAAA